MTQRLPLFPLGTVLFPGLLLPLHVFEERYRVLVRDLVDGPPEARSFGIVAIREGREVGADGVQALHTVGCLAELRQVEPYADGRFDIVTNGTRRFRLGALDQSGPYLRAAVDFLDEPDGEAAPQLARRVGALWNAYRSVLTRAQLEEDADLPDEPSVLSYLVASATILDLREKQRLLEEPDTTSRLRRELAILRREAALLRLLPSLPAVELTRTAVSSN
ncbi:MAG: LON peptidase substrate-binding domain-containing protein [Actinomycetes bacterium]